MPGKGDYRGPPPQLFAARGVDQLFEGLEADRAGDDLITDHEARRAANVERRGKAGIGFDHPVDVRSCHVALETLDIEPTELATRNTAASSSCPFWAIKARCMA